MSFDKEPVLEISDYKYHCNQRLDRLQYNNKINQNPDYQRLIRRQCRQQSLSQTELRVPCLFYTSKRHTRLSDSVMLYFHANAENIFHVQKFCESVCTQLGLNVVAVEYTGYGLYTNEPSSEQSIKRDSKSIIGYIIEELNFPCDKIILCGRSIGCHFAISASKYFPVQSLVLIAPFSSIKQFV